MPEFLTCLTNLSTGQLYLNSTSEVEGATISKFPRLPKSFSFLEFFLSFTEDEYFFLSTFWFTPASPIDLFFLRGQESFLRIASPAVILLYSAALCTSSDRHKDTEAALSTARTCIGGSLIIFTCSAVRSSCFMVARVQLYSVVYSCTSVQCGEQLYLA